MTNKSKPGRQGGIAGVIALEAQIQTARYAMFRLLRAGAPYERLREAWSKLETLLDTPSNSDSGAPQPRGEPPQTNATQPGGSPNIATRKPAPDAVREALERYGRHDNDCEVRPWHGKGPVRCSCGFYAALAAPVPSPDGAVVKLQEIVDLDSHGRYGRLAREAIALLSPSATGATEPVAISEQQIFDEAKRRYEGHGRFQRVFIEGAAWGIHHRAAPPVRGDREALQNHVNRIFGAIHDYSDMTPESDETWESWYHAAFDLLATKIKTETGAILSLPIQPGAVEREALERYGHHDEGCEIEPWHGKGPVRCSCGLYDTLSRQPPQSSSEGGQRVPQGEC